MVVYKVDRHFSNYVNNQTKKQKIAAANSTWKSSLAALTFPSLSFTIAKSRLAFLFLNQ